MLVTSRNPPRAWAVLALAGLFTAMAGMTALPASAAPVVAAAVAPVIASPIDGTVIHDLPFADGTGEAGTTAVVSDSDGTRVCSAVVDAGGSFSCSGSQRLPAGPHALSVSTTDAAGTTTGGNTVQIQVVYYPNISSPEPGAVISAGQSFNGAALPGLRVQMLDTAHNAVCTTTADEFGNFQCTPGTPFALGPLTLLPAMTAADGAVVMGDPATWTVIADPVITSPGNGQVIGDLPEFLGTGQPGASIDIVHGHSGFSLCSATVGADGNFSCRVTRRLLVGSLEVFPATSWGQPGQVAGAMISVAVKVTPRITSPADGGAIAALPVVEGTAGARSNVAILDESGKTVCTAVADANGAFGCSAKSALAPGRHALTPVQTSLDGQAVRGAAVNATVRGTVSGPVTPTPPAPQQDPAAPVAASPAAANPAAVAVQGTTSVSLANTGAGGTAGAVLGAGALLVAGTGTLLMLRRRTSRK